LKQPWIVFTPPRFYSTDVYEGVFEPCGLCFHIDVAFVMETVNKESRS
jgi:hypothetical protein